MMDLETFLSLPTEEVARIVREAGPKVCVFPINGTRRWFMLEYSTSLKEQWAADYLHAVSKRHIELYRVLFEHGIDYLLTPIFGPDLLERGKAYMDLAAEGMTYLVTHKMFIDFYEACDVRVRFYGDHRRYLEHTPYAYLSDMFDEIAERTRLHQRYRLFFGVFAHDATEAVARLAIEYYRQNQCVPDKRTLVELYYGEYVPPVSFFIGFDKFAAFDMPLVATGSEDLYFTVAPSPYLTEKQLREILYDHLYMRPGESDYEDLSAEDLEVMREFYNLNREKTIGVGAKLVRGEFWCPLPQVEIPVGLV